ncbi:MAG: nuclear transport factor 2 family protein [Kordiimonadaceae bacterium]|mgnify:CR=1 FL=1|jgi:ketosteroid isomerase-like protein|nr:nuclear transport factor 2 family protein [Kordiimonadaceae bacterium]MBT6037260.1 nuclear transport factor 2 family protein [Kordiimonadaceae bacterium]MBT6330583.1 nuclear transport factor 2 family protein [Kordiimonadaceae bacterium]
MRKLIIIFIALFPLTLFWNASLAATADQIKKEVAETERAFAKSMADRDFQAFQSFIAEDTVFWSGTEAQQGKESVLEGWKGFFEGPHAPFKWEPETVLVLEEGNLALSTGPVTGPDNIISSYFTSVWQKNDQGKWKIIFDKGQKYCAP